jgi:hypothetical protein
MAIEKYTCRCGNKVNTISSYFVNGIRVTLCEKCADEYGLTKDEAVIKVDYATIEKSGKEENFYHQIDTREIKQ